MTRERSRPARRVPLLVWAVVPAALLLLAAANLHLLYVALESQPECVAHLKAPGAGDGKYRAAKSAC